MSLLSLLLACAGPSGPGPVDTGDPIAVVDQDQDGWPQDQDCDDTDPSVHPEAQELCDQEDQDCDLKVDEGLPVETWYLDADLDGYGWLEESRTGCARPEGSWVSPGTDCDDTDADIHPGADERCDDIDQDCDEQIDEGLPLIQGWVDQDGDGFGDPLQVREDCVTPPDTVANDQDCDDDDPSVYPGGSEDWTNDQDDDCDGEVEHTGPVALTGGSGTFDLHFALPAREALRVVVVPTPGTVRIEVDLAQPTTLALVGPDATEWEVVDPAGTVGETWVFDEIPLTLDLDDPQFYVQRQAIEAELGPLSSWHGLPRGENLRLADTEAFPDRQGWPDCDGPAPAEDIAPPDLAVLGLLCPDLGGTRCLTATDEALVAFDLVGGLCTIAALPSPPAGQTLLWSGGSALLTEQPYGNLARIDLLSGARDRAWLWPQAVLSHAEGALLVPSPVQTELDLDIVYLYEGWGPLSCGDGANLTDVWAEDLSTSTLSGDSAWWWESGEALSSWDLRADAGRELLVPGLDGVTGIELLPDGRLGLLVDGALWQVDPANGLVLETLELGVHGQGLRCAG